MADLQIPHLQDPGEHNLQIIQHASLDFKVRVGTSLARSSPESQTVTISGVEFSLFSKAPYSFRLLKNLPTLFPLTMPLIPYPLLQSIELLLELEGVVLRDISLF
jgi:hypothetical protein